MYGHVSMCKHPLTWPVQGIDEPSILLPGFCRGQMCTSCGVMPSWSLRQGCAA